MKKIYKVVALIAVFVLVGYLAQAQPHAGQSSGGGAVVGGRIGAGAPIGSGTILLVALASAYGGRKIYKVNRNVSIME
jgi:hypothetical protein